MDFINTLAEVPGVARGIYKKSNFEKNICFLKKKLTYIQI